MTDRNTPDASPEAFVGLPLQPTGSGVADLEIAYEQMKLARMPIQSAHRRAIALSTART